MEVSLARKLVAEFIGTLFLTFMGFQAIIANQISGGGVTLVGIGLAFGLSLMVMIYALGHISGAHLNPAVTLGLAIGRHMHWGIASAYWVAQVLGGIAAAALLVVLWGTDRLPVPGPGVLPGFAAQPWQAVVVELILTFMLVFVVTSVATDVRAVGTMAGLAIGGAVIAGTLAGGPFSGAAMNPAVALGPSLLAGNLSNVWIYVVGPLAGGVLAGFLYMVLRGPGSYRPA